MRPNLKTLLATAAVAVLVGGPVLYARAEAPNPASGNTMQDRQDGTTGGGSMMGQGSGNMMGSQGGMNSMMTMMQQMNQMMETCNQMMAGMVQHHGSVTPKKGTSLDKQG